LFFIHVDIFEFYLYIGEYICAKQARLYIWEIFSGSSVEILDHECGKSIADITWDSYRPIIISISDGILIAIKI